MLIIALLFGCPPDPGKDTSTDTAEGVDSGDTAGLDTAACEDVDGDLDAPDAPGCAGAGGVCLGQEAACAGGERLAEHDGECTFDDGPGYCCRPPEAAAEGDDCAATGGACAPIAGCGMVHGWYTPAGECSDTYGVGSVCCAPADACDGWGVVACCTDDGATAFVAACDRGDLACTIDGTVLGCEQDCPAFGG